MDYRSCQSQNQFPERRGGELESVPESGGNGRQNQGEAVRNRHGELSEQTRDQPLPADLVDLRGSLGALLPGQLRRHRERVQNQPDQFELDDSEKRRAAGVRCPTGRSEGAQGQVPEQRVQTEDRGEIDEYAHHGAQFKQNWQRHKEDSQ